MATSRNVLIASTLAASVAGVFLGASGEVTSPPGAASEEALHPAVVWSGDNTAIK